MGRRLELDAIRGLMLVWITVTHLPTVASTYVNQPFGFISAAEGFIFLSALFTGRIYSRMAEHDGYRAMTLKLWLRTVRLYGYHALLLAFVFLVAVPIASRGHRPGLHNLLDFYFIAGTKRAITEAFLLIYRPPLLDILPMYIIFLAFTSVALLLARKVGWKPILQAAFVVWLFAQFGFRSAEHNFMMRFIPTRIPLNEMGSFDLWAWQFLWIAGIWFGVRWGKGNLRVEAWARRVVIPAALIVCVGFVLRHEISRGLQLGLAEFLFDKWHLGPLRLLNFAAGATLLIFAQSILKPLAIRPLVMMGQCSLQVFCVHLLFCFAGITLMGNASMLSGWRQVALLTATFAAMLLTAKLFAKSEAKQEAQPKAELPFGTATEVRPAARAAVA
ncbi:MAG: OpgC domain-containing protein [Acidobacteriota bacterium]|nr:OpgC domain-containing protein [Acidobacteriota bacterium]